MKVIILQELIAYTFEELLNKLNTEEHTLQEILKSLSFMNIVRRGLSSSDKVELEDLLEVEDLDELNDKIDKNIFIFKFVGVITVGEVCLIIYPKYIKDVVEDKNNDYKKLRQILDVIRKYKSKEQKQSLISTNEGAFFNLLAITLELIIRYHEDGLYSRDQDIIETNGFGEILWEKSINESNMYFIDDSPLYLDLFTQNIESNESDYFRLLHQVVITESCMRTKDILNVMGVEPLTLSSLNIDFFGNRDFIVHKINQELSNQFVTKKQEILNLIKSYVLNSDTSSISEDLSFVGTTSFNLVWEDVCAVVMGNNLNTPLKELGLSYSEDNRKSALLKDVIKKPSWEHYESGKIHLARKSLEPDLIVVEDNKLSIYDAKYYKIKLDEDGVSHQPGIQDVMKQYLYELAFRQLADENKLMIHKNAFLMPIDGIKDIVLGEASFPVLTGINNRSLNNIQVILLPCKIMFDK